MTTYVALLRAINVGGRNKIKMDDLRAVFAGMGHTEVTTYIQSGNVVFTNPSKSAVKLASAIESAITDELGLDVTVVVRSRSELAAAIERNPFAGAVADPSKLHVGFLSAAPAAKAVRSIDLPGAAGEELRVLGREMYLHYPNGMGRTKLTNVFLERRLDVRMTVRNWNTVNKLLDLAGG